MITAKYICSLLVSITLVLFVILLCHNDRLKKEKIALEVQRKIQERRISDLENYKSEIMTLIAQIKRSLQEYQFSEELIQRCESYTTIFITGKPVVDALIAYKMDVCTEKHILFVADIKHSIPGTLSDKEYVALLGNLLDNAIEAAEHTANPWVSIYSKRTQGQWLLHIKNSKLRDSQPLEYNMMTTKKEKENHGYGTRIINLIIKKHRGEIERKDNGDNFEIFIALSDVK